MVIPTNIILLLHHGSSQQRSFVRQEDIRNWAISGRESQMEKSVVIIASYLHITARTFSNPSLSATSIELSLAFGGGKRLCISLPCGLNARLRFYQKRHSRRFDYSRNQKMFTSGGRPPDSSVPAASSLIEARSSVADIYP